MTTYGWQNDEGEPIMDGAAYRFEQQLDAEYDAQRDPYDPYDHYDEGESDCSAYGQEHCDGSDLDYLGQGEGDRGECPWCGKRWPWIDG